MLTFEQIKARPRYRGVSDEAAFDDFHQSYFADIPRAKLAEAIGYEIPDKPLTDDVAETGKAFARGALGGFNKMAGQAIQATAPDGSAADRYGQFAEEYGTKYEKDHPADMEGRGPIATMAIEGAEQLPPMLATIGAAGAGTLAGGPVGGVAAGTSAATWLYGGSTYKDSFDRLKAQGATDQEAHDAALNNAFIDSLGETAATAIGGGMLNAGKKALKGTIEKIIGDATDTAILKPYAKSTALGMAGEVATESTQDVTKELNERSFGAGNQDSLWDVAKQPVAGTIGATFFLSLAGLRGHYRNSQRAEQANYLLDNPENPDARSALVTELHKAAKDSGAPDADAWLLGAKNDIANNRPIRRTATVDAGDVSAAESVDEAITAFEASVKQPPRPGYEDYMQRDTAQGGRYGEKARLGYDGQTIEGELLDPDPTISQDRAALPPGYIDAQPAASGMLGQQRRLADQKRLAGPPTSDKAAADSVQAPQAIRDIITSAARKYGVSEYAMLKAAQIESHFDPNAKNPKSTAGGLYQFIDDTAKQYNLINRYDPAQAADAAARLMRDNQNYLAKKLGRMPSPGELYLAHQQGLGGAARLLLNPEADAASIVGKDAVRLNGGHPGMTAGEFAQLWTAKFDKTEQAALPSPAQSTETGNATPSPTHETNDGIPLWHNPEDDSYQDAEGNYWGAEDATPIQTATRAKYEQSQPTENEAAQEEAGAATVADVAPLPAPGEGNPSPTHSFRNDGLEAFVTPNTDGKRFNVTVRDMESGEFFHEEGRIFNHEGDAIKHAQKKIGAPATSAAPPSAPAPVPESQFIRKPNAKEKIGGTARQRGFQSIPDKPGYDKVYQPYGAQGPGYYYAPKGVAAQPIEINQKKPYKRPAIKRTDELKQVISKLGGIRYTDHADRAGFTDYRLAKHQQAFNLFHNGAKAKTFDEMAELLRERGFDDIDGENTLIEKLYGSLNNSPHYTAEGWAEHMAKQADYQDDEQLSEDEAALATELDEAIDEGAVDASILDEDPFDDNFEGKALSKAEANAFWGLDEDENATDTGKAQAVPAGTAKSDTASGETPAGEAQDDDFLTPYSPTPAKTAKPKPTDTTLDLFADEKEQKRLAEKQKIHDLIKKKDDQRNPDAPSGGDLFEQPAIQGQQDVADATTTEIRANDANSTPTKAEPDTRTKIAELRKQAASKRKEAEDYNKSTDGRAVKNKGRNNIHETNRNGGSGVSTFISPMSENRESAHHRQLVDQAKELSKQAAELEKTLVKKQVDRKPSLTIQKIDTKKAIGMTKAGYNTDVYNITNINKPVLDALGFESIYFKPGMPQEVYARLPDGGFKHLFDGDARTDTIAYIKDRLKGDHQPSETQKDVSQDAKAAHEALKRTENSNGIAIGRGKYAEIQRDGNLLPLQDVEHDKQSLKLLEKLAKAFPGELNKNTGEYGMERILSLNPKKQQAIVIDSDGNPKLFAAGSFGSSWNYLGNVVQPGKSGGEENKPEKAIGAETQKKFALLEKSKSKVFGHRSSTKGEAIRNMVRGGYTFKTFRKPDSKQKDVDQKLVRETEEAVNGLRTMTVPLPRLEDRWNKLAENAKNGELDKAKARILANDYYSEGYEAASPYGNQRSDISKLEYGYAQHLLAQEESTNEPVGQPAPPRAREDERFDVGKSLTKEQRNQVLKTLVDVYKSKGADKEVRINANGDEYAAYPYQPELFEKSDITGQMVRYFVTLFDGRIAHPTELFPDMTQANIDAQLSQIKHDEEISNRTRERLLNAGQESVAEANALFKKGHYSELNPDYYGKHVDASILFENEGKYIRVREESYADILLSEGWKIRSVNENAPEKYHKLFDGDKAQDGEPAPDTLTPDELKLSYQRHNDQIIEAIGPELRKAAGVASQREFDSLPFNDQQAAYVNYVEQGGDPVLATDATMTVTNAEGKAEQMPIADVMANLQERKAALEKYLDCTRAV